MTQPDLTSALVAEAAKKSDLLWVGPRDEVPRPLWHIWYGDAVLVVTGGLEQPDPGLEHGSTVTLLLRSKDKGTRLLTVPAAVQRVTADSAEWEELAAALHAKRLNSPDGDAAIDRWRRESAVWRLVPTGDLVEGPDAMSDSSHRAEPLPTPATTSTRRPFHLGRATHLRR